MRLERLEKWEKRENYRLGSGGSRHGVIAFVVGLFIHGGR